MLVRFGSTFSLFRAGFNRNLNFWHECLRSQSSPSKYLEEIKTKPFNEDDKNIWVSPPHPKSNLRLKVFPSFKDLTKEEKEFFKQYEKTQDWNQKYWEAHNSDFKESKELYTAKIVKEKKLSKDEVLTDEDMSRFYQDFLQRNHKKHIRYNWDWYQKNFNLLYLAAKVNVAKMKKYFVN